MPRSVCSTSARSCRSRACDWSARCRRTCRIISCSVPRSRSAIRRRSRLWPSSRRSPRRRRAMLGATPAWSRWRRRIEFRSFPRKRESSLWVPAFAGMSGTLTRRNLLPVRRAFFEKGANAFLRSVRSHHVAEIFDRGGDASPIVVLPHEGCSRLTHDRRRFGGEIRRERDGGCFKLSVDNDFADEPEFKCFLRIERPAAEQNLESAVTAGDARQMREMNGRQNADVDFRIAECRLLPGENDIAGNRHGHAAAARRAADGRDRWLAEIVLALMQLDIEGG